MSIPLPLLQICLEPLLEMIWRPKSLEKLSPRPHRKVLAASGHNIIQLLLERDQQHQGLILNGSVRALSTAIQRAPTATWWSCPSKLSIVSLERRERDFIVSGTQFTVRWECCPPPYADGAYRAADVPLSLQRIAPEDNLEPSHLYVSRTLSWVDDDAINDGGVRAV